MGSSWPMSEKKMAKGIAVAYMDEDIAQLMKINGLEQQSQVKKEFEYVYKSLQCYYGIKRSSGDELQIRWMCGIPNNIWKYYAG